VSLVKKCVLRASAENKMASGANDLAEGYRITELGPLPAEWKIVRLEDIIELIRNGLTKTQNRDGNGIPVSRIETIADERIDPARVGFLDGLTETEIDTYKLAVGDILLSHINSESQIGKSAVYDGNPSLLLHGMNLLLIRTSPGKCSSSYLNGLFKHFRAKGVFAGLAARAVGQASINQGRLRALAVSLPPLPEQNRIAGVLGAVQEAKEKTEAVIAAAKELKKSLMEHLFTYGPVPVEDAENVPLKETEIGEIPEAWSIASLGSIATLQRGFDLPKQRQVPGRYPIVGSSGVIGYHNEFMSEGPGIVTGRSGTIGKMTYVDTEYWPHNTGLFVKDFHGNNPRFVFYLMHFLDFKKYATGVSVPTLNRNFIHAAILPLPPHDTQIAIAKMLLLADEKIAVEESKRKALDQLFKTLLNDLMTARIRVNRLEVEA